MVKTLDEVLHYMWKEYLDTNPDVLAIYDLLTELGENVVNDHIALRTFNHPKLGIESLAKYFKAHGYVEKGEYIFDAKSLYAKHYEHLDPKYPKIFISELQLEKFSHSLQNIVGELVIEMELNMMDDPCLLTSDRLWNISYEDYRNLSLESEYAAWVYAFGFRPNHFTVSVNALRKYNNMVDLNNLLKENGFVLNSSGGEIKGTPSEYLEQSSTMARDISVKFIDGEYLIPSCFYEFAKRYVLPNGDLYSGFIAKSADKIFESTNRL